MSGTDANQICDQCGYPRVGLLAGPCPECGSDKFVDRRQVRGRIPLWSVGVAVLPLLPMLAGIVEDHSDFGFPGTRLAMTLQFISLAIWIPCITIGLGTALRGRNFEPYWTAGGVAFISLVLGWPLCYMLTVVIVAQLQGP